MKTTLRLLSFLSFTLTILLILMALLSLFESSLLKPGLMFAEAEDLLMFAVISFIFCITTIYIRKKIFKNSKYDY